MILSYPYGQSEYNSTMRRKSSIDRARQKERIERARGMTPEGRLVACVKISRLVKEIQRAGERYRQETGRIPIHEDYWSRPA